MSRAKAFSGSLSRVRSAIPALGALPQRHRTRGQRRWQLFWGRDQVGDQLQSFQQHRVRILCLHCLYAVVYVNVAQETLASEATFVRVSIGSTLMAFRASYSFEWLRVLPASLSLSRRPSSRDGRM